MHPTRKAISESSRNEVQAALAALDSDELRDVVREIMVELDDQAHSRAVNAILRRGARSGSGTVPAALDDADVAEAVAFAEAAKRVGYADPADVDERLRCGVAAFLRRDYAAARRIFGGLLPPLADGDIDLGQDELISEVLDVDAAECATQYVVATYMTSEPARRAEAVRAAIAEVRGASFFLEPIREMEGAVSEALPGLAEFLTAWRVIVEREAAGGRDSDWDGDAPRWRREVVRRIEGPDGLAKVARATRRADDMRAWCDSLMEAEDWKAALSACEEAAALVTERAFGPAGFLDRAAFAAQKMGEQDVSPWLERAWRAQPTMARLRRWLGRAGTKQSLHERAAEALKACPQQAARQRAFLHLLQGEVEQTADLLAKAPSLGWSNGEHPGHLIFPLFQTLLGGNGASRHASAVPDAGTGIEDLDRLASEDEEPQLATPEVNDILRDAGVQGVTDAKARQAMLAAMRTAAELRVAGVTTHKRRGHYGHAASLVAACVACDRSTETGQWAATLRKTYQRFPALCGEFNRRMGSI